MRIIALATGLGDKAVSLVYERVQRQYQSKCGSTAATRRSGPCSRCSKRSGPREDAYWFGKGIGHSDIAVACVLRFTGEVHPALLSAARYPALTAHAARCEALPPFQEIVQPLAPPKG